MTKPTTNHTRPVAISVTQLISYTTNPNHQRIRTQFCPTVDEEQSD